MSQYVSFYISDGEQFISLDEFSRSTEIYKAMAELQAHGFMSFPVVTVDGWDNAWTGFEIDRLEELL